MRLDKFLKVSRLIKQRQKAKSVCDAGRVKIGGKVEKAGTRVKEGDTLELVAGNRRIVAEIIRIPVGNVSKQEAQSLVRITEEIVCDEEW